MKSDDSNITRRHLLHIPHESQGIKLAPEETKASRAPAGWRQSSEHHTRSVRASEGGWGVFATSEINH